MAMDRTLQIDVRLYQRLERESDTPAWMVDDGPNTLEATLCEAGFDLSAEAPKVIRSVGPGGGAVIFRQTLPDPA
jgi:hypothetical protein